MTKLTKMSINFDLNIEELKKHYPKQSYTTAYTDIRNYMLKHGFEHVQGSGYVSVKPMNKSSMATIIYQMSKTFPWLHKCTRISKATQVAEDSYDLEDILKAPYKNRYSKEQINTKPKAKLMPRSKTNNHQGLRR